MIPEVGYGVLPGQWGTLKTFLALDLAASVMSGNIFIQFEVRRQGGVLFVACEGENEIPVRLEAVLKEKYPSIDKAPFAWVSGCPRLLNPNAAKILTAMVNDAAERMRQEFNLPVALIIVDTTSKAAGYTKGGEDNDTAIAKIIASKLYAVAQACGVFILGIDHFGKDVTVGTRGSSSKEDDVDVILAALGEKDTTGRVSDTRLCLRKRRGGPNGEEFLYSGRVINMGFDQYGAPMSTLVIDWEPMPTEVRPERTPWKKASLQRLRKSIDTLTAAMKVHELFPDDTKVPVQAVDVEDVRKEFYARFMAEGTPEQKADTRRKAFKRAIDEATTTGALGLREQDGVTWIWTLRE